MATRKKTGKKESNPEVRAKADNLEEVKKAIAEVDTTIREPETADAPEDAGDEGLSKSEAHIEEMGREMERLRDRQQTLREELEKNPDDAERLLNEELSKAREAYKRITYSDSYYTSTWNGQSCY